MDAFQKSEAKRPLLARGIVASWVEFRSGIESLIRSYNETQQGESYPAVIASGERGIVISTERSGGDQVHSVTIAVTISLDEGQHLIAALKETWWLNRQGGLAKRQEDRYTFKLDGDPEEGKVWLASSDFGNCTPPQAAEALLVKTLS